MLSSQHLIFTVGKLFRSASRTQSAHLDRISENRAPFSLMTCECALRLQPTISDIGLSDTPLTVTLFYTQKELFYTKKYRIE